MKRAILLTILTFASAMVFAQTPQALKYQAVVRDASGNPIASNPVSIRLTIQEGMMGGPAIYVELHFTSTNDFGLVNLEVGRGTPVTGTFGAVDWGSNLYFLSVEVDPTGGGSFIWMGSTQLLSVPYALHALTVENDSVEDADADPGNEIQDLSLSGTNLSISGGTGVDLSGLGGSPQTLSVSGSDLSISGGNTVTLPDSVDDADADPANEIQSLSYSTTGDTLYLSGSNYILIPGLSMMNSEPVQVLLDGGVTPCDIIARGFPLDSLYGKTYGGGLIFHLITSSCEVFVSSNTDQSTGAPWGCEGTNISGTSGAYGAGDVNTIAIESGCTTPGTAADICANLTYNGYSDWHLPSTGELTLIYDNLILNSFGFMFGEYWTSTQMAGPPGNDNANYRDFSPPATGSDLKSSFKKVRAIRAFIP